jgi:hypothetical protein
MQKEATMGDIKKDREEKEEKGVPLQSWEPSHKVILKAMDDWGEDVCRWMAPRIEARSSEPR